MSVKTASRRHAEPTETPEQDLGSPHTTICVAHHFEAPPERVFDAWLDPEKARYWFAPGMGEVVRVEIHSRVGGSFSILQRRGSQEIDHRGEYCKIDRPRQLIFTMGEPQDSPDTSRVVIDIVPSGLGSDLTLSHEIHPDWAQASLTEGTWRAMLDAMEETLK